jgi:hypothetical protein
MLIGAVLEFALGAFGGVRGGPFWVQIRHPQEEPVRRRPGANAKYGVR